MAWPAATTAQTRKVAPVEHVIPAYYAPGVLPRQGCPTHYYTHDWIYPAHCFNAIWSCIGWTVHDLRAVAPKVEALGINIALENHESFQGVALANIFGQVNPPVYAHSTITAIHNWLPKNR